MKKISAIALGLSLALASHAATAAVGADEAARLDGELTPFGAIRAGNAEGTIPAWDGGITAPPAGYTPGDHHVDPYAGEQPLFRITAANMAEYADKLSEGQKALLSTYDSYYLDVYPTHRSASAPQRIYDATRQAATVAQLADGGNGVSGTAQAIPFPIPQNGLEAIWNHLLRYRGDAVARNTVQAAPTRDGDYTLVKYEDQIFFTYHQPEATEANIDNRILLFKQAIVAPARLAGKMLVAYETLNQNLEPRKAWVYNPGQRRVRRAPNIAFDTPRDGSDGLLTSDQFDMFNGSPSRYDWELVGRKEMYVPYNSYAVHQPNLDTADILNPLHVNPAHLRYELHRVWVVEARLKDDARHVFSRRTFYIDEDSWQILLTDQYDNRGEIWRVSEGHAINYYDAQTYWTTLEVHTDLQSGRYFAVGLDNQEKMYDFGIKPSEREFSAAALRREGRR